MFDFMAIVAMLESSFKSELEAICATLPSLQSDGVASVSISTPNGGSRTVTYANKREMIERQKELISILAEMNRAKQGGSGIVIGYPIFCGGGC